MKTRTIIIGILMCGIILLIYVVFVFLTTDFVPPVDVGVKGDSSLLHKVDRLLEALAFGNIAFNTPRSINVRDTATIQLMLGVPITIDKLKEMIKAEGVKEGARIRMSDRMEASLSGSNFVITKITPEIQAISRKDITEWKWMVKPRNSGRHNLNLTLSVLLNVDGISTPRAIRVFEREIEVNVAWRQQVGLFLHLAPCGRTFDRRWAP